MVRLSGCNCREIPTCSRDAFRRFDSEEPYATKQEGNTETHTSRDEEEYDRDSPKTAKFKEERIGGKEPR